VILSALNPPPAQFSFLDALGFDSREVKTVIVMDRATAEWLASMFPGCTVRPLDGLGHMPSKGKPGRPCQHDSDADRKRAGRNQFKSELRMALDLVAGSDRAARHYSPAIAKLRQQMSEFGYGKDATLSTMGRADLGSRADRAPHHPAARTYAGQDGQTR
jgi:hypothetical protein